jgi:hypothetical protein
MKGLKEKEGREKRKSDRDLNKKKRKDRNRKKGIGDKEITKIK